jgi:betaine-aldehyde dehydrogenase
MKTFRNFVNGSFVDAQSGETTNIVNPANGQVYATAALSR